MIDDFDLGKGEPQLLQVSALPQLSVPQLEQARGRLFSGWLVRRNGRIISPQPVHHRQPPGLFLPHLLQQTFAKARPFYLKLKEPLAKLPIYLK